MNIPIDEHGDIKSIPPRRIADVINKTQPAVVSVRTAGGDEMTITNISIDVRPNGIHILLDTPEACRLED